MDKKELIIIAVIVLIIIAAALANTFILNPSSGSDTSRINILNNNTLGENNTLYVKLTNAEGVSLSDKNIDITVRDANNTIVYNTTTKTHFTGVAVVKINDLDNGEYTVNASFAGDDNYTQSSVVHKITIGDGVVEEDLSNITEIAQDTTLADDIAEQTAEYDSQSSQSYQSSSSSQQSYTPSRSTSSSSSSSSSSGSSSSSSDSGGYYDENGASISPIIDENGKESYDY